MSTLRKSSSHFVTSSKTKYERPVSNSESLKELVFRQPFPGPGLGIRIIGEVTAEKVRIVQDADAIYREEIANAGLGPGNQPVLRSPHKHALCWRNGRLREPTTTQ